MSKRHLFLLPGITLSIVAFGGGCGNPGASGSSTTASSSHSSASSGTTGGGGSGTGSSTGTGGSAGSPCPATGPGAIVAPGVTCLTVTPAETGAAAAGVNALAPNYALFPATGANGKLVLSLNGSTGHPANSIATPDHNFYTAATSLGYAVLALSYRSDQEVATLCAGVDACFLPTRQTIIAGVYQAGAAATLQDVTLDEGITDRAVLALRWLGEHDAGHAWSSFLQSADGGTDPGAQLAWGNIVVAGHSQGGGHAAAIGKLFAVNRVLQLSATCDEVKGVPATWLMGTTGTWKTSPALLYYGLDVATTFSGGVPTGGDTTCPTHALGWQSLEMTAARSDDAAATCSTVALVHNASILCANNEAAWQSMLE